MSLDAWADDRPKPSNGSEDDDVDDVDDADDAVFLSDHHIEYGIVQRNRLVPAGRDGRARIHEWEREREALVRLEYWARLEQRSRRWHARAHRSMYALAAWAAVADDLAHLLARWRRPARHLLRSIGIRPRRRLPNARPAGERRADMAQQTPHTSHTPQTP